MSAARKQRWQQATALVSLSTAGAMTGIAFAHGSVADVTSPTSVPAHLLAFKQATRPVPAGDGALRSAIVSSAKYYLRLAQGKTPAEMEALIWQQDSTDGADHGESCAAFASLTLEAGAQATGQQSWVIGGTSYPWPLHAWADVRVDPNPQSLGVVSILQDAEAHDRWHPLGDGYTPQPGDWVLFAGHVEVVTKYSGGVLYAIGADSMPNLSVNAHQYDAPLAALGVTGFVNNGELQSADSPPTAAGAAATPTQDQAANPQDRGQADIPGAVVPAVNALAGGQAQQAAPSAPAQPAPSAPVVTLGTAAIPGAGGPSASHRYGRSQVAPTAPQDADTSAQQAFIRDVAHGAVAAQRQYGVPAAVTIAQAIDESGWGQSRLATQDLNLFGIKGTGPAGSVVMPTQEYENGQWVTINAPFRVYNSIAESITDHSLLLATGSSYKQAMADRADPDAFANDLTGVYATDPNYGANLITIMRLYNLYRYDAGTQAARPTSAAAGSALGPAVQSGTWQNITGASAGASANGARGVMGYGPALSVAAGGPSLSRVGAVAEANQALQSASSGAAAIPGAAGPSPARAGREAAHDARHRGANAHRTGRGASAARSADGADPGQRAPASSTTPGAAQPRSAAGGSALSGASASALAGARGSGVNGAAGSGINAAGGSGLSGAGGSGQGRAGASRLRTVGGRGSSKAAGRSGQSAAAGRAGPSTAGGRAAKARAGPGAGSGGPSRSSGLSGGAAGASRGPLASTSGPPLGGVSGAPLGGARIPGAPPAASGGRQASTGRPMTAGPRNARISTRRYVAQIPQAVTTAFITTAKTPLLRSEPLYRDVASETGVHWQLLAACDWMQCRAQPRVSPVYGEKLGTKNADGTVYRTKAEALKQCARDLIVLASAVYGIELTERLQLSVRDLAKIFAAFRWGGLLAAHYVSALEFPYSVAGLTSHHLKMRWPDVPGAPGSDKPGARFPMAFGAVPVVLGLDYRAAA